jgi:bacterioferritin (cytochrome b1)
MAYQESWSDWWRQFIGLSADSYREILKLLQERYVDEMQHVKLYTAHAEKMRYRQFRERLLAIAADEARHAEWLAERIDLLGGKLANVPEVKTSEKNSWQDLLADLDEEKHCSAELIAMMQTVRNEMPETAEVLERIYEDGIKHRTEIRDMLMRSDPQSQ